jgi:hypothetical protein
MENGKSRTAKTEKNELIYAVAGVLLFEFARHCKKNIVEYVLKPMIKKRLGAQFRLGNLIVTVETKTTKGVLNADELHRHMRELASTAPWLDAVYGIATNGTEAEYYVLKRGSTENPELKTRGSLSEVATAATADFCAGKIPVASPEDIADIFRI